MLEEGTITSVLSLFFNLSGDLNEYKKVEGIAGISGKKRDAGDTSGR